MRDCSPDLSRLRRGAQGVIILRPSPSFFIQPASNPVRGTPHGKGRFFGPYCLRVEGQFGRNISKKIQLLKTMNSIVYIIGAIVIVVVILKVLGLF